MGSKNKPAGFLYTEKMAGVVLLNVLRIGFSAPPPWEYCEHCGLNVSAVTQCSQLFMCELQMSLRPQLKDSVIIAQILNPL